MGISCHSGLSYTISIRLVGLKRCKPIENQDEQFHFFCFKLRADKNQVKILECMSKVEVGQRYLAFCF